MSSYRLRILKTTVGEMKNQERLVSWLSPPRIVLSVILATIAVMPATAAADPDCSQKGLEAGRKGGPSAALDRFREALRRPECSADALLQLNYAMALSKADDTTGFRSCVAAEYFHRSAQELEGALAELARDNAPKAEARCAHFTSRARPETTDLVVSKGRAAAKVGGFDRAAILFRIATRLDPNARPAYQALCDLLPKLNRPSEARANCQTARALRSQRRQSASADRTTEWILSGSAVAILAAGGIAFVQATTAADEAWDAQNKAREAAILSGEDPDQLTALDDALSTRADANERARTLQFLSWGLVGVGSAVGVAAVVMWLDDTGSASVGVGPNQVTLQFAW